MELVAQIQLATVLAKGGHADGWPFVLHGVQTDVAAMALENVDNFDGLMTKDGSRINVADELDAIRDSVPLAVQTQIMKKILQLRAAPRSQP
jgi:hypothetical protein